MHKNHCPCGSPMSYLDCCSPLHLNQNSAKSAEQLMRSRFCAFYYLAENTDTCIRYLLKTWRPKHDFDQQKEQQQLSKNSTQQQWQSLSIINATENQDHASVEFVAFFLDNKHSHVQQLHERSEFKRIDNRWFYYKGELLTDIKLQRNEPCWCGSGKKLKKCHA